MGKLAGTLHLFRGSVARADQTVDHILRRAGLPRPQRDARPGGRRGGHSPLQQRGGRTYHRLRSTLPQVVQGRQALLFGLARYAFRLVEGKFPAAEDRDALPEKRAQIRGKGIRRRIVRRDYHQGPARFHFQRSGQMCAVHGPEARYEGRQSAPLDGVREGGQIFIFQNRQGQCFHVYYLVRLF